MTKTVLFTIAGFAARTIHSSFKYPLFAAGAGVGFGGMACLACKKWIPKRYDPFRRRVYTFKHRHDGEIQLASVLLAVTLNHISAKLSSPVGFSAGVYLGVTAASHYVRTQAASFKLAGL